MALFQAHPLGPILVHDYDHEGRPPARIYLELRTPFRFNFEQYDWNGALVSQSGWIGRAWEDT